MIKRDINRQTKLVRLYLHKMSESKIVIGVLAGEWLPLHHTNGWIQISDMYIRIRREKTFNFIDVVMLDDDVSVPLFKYAAENNYKYSIGELPDDDSIDYKKERASQLDLPVKFTAKLFKVASWKVSRHHFERLAMDARKTMTDHQKEMFAAIKSELS